MASTKVNDDLKKVHRGHNAYGKALDKVWRPPFRSTYTDDSRNFPVKALPTDYDALASHPSLINRAHSNAPITRRPIFPSPQPSSPKLSPTHQVLRPHPGHPTRNPNNDSTSLKHPQIPRAAREIFKHVPKSSTNSNPEIYTQPSNGHGKNSTELENRGFKSRVRTLKAPIHMALLRILSKRSPG